MTAAPYQLTYVASSQVVSLYPNWDFQFAPTKQETANRSRTGAQFRYVWGNYNTVSFTVEFVSSSDKCVISSWWTTNTPLVLYDQNGTAVISGHLVNLTHPISKYMEPYNDQFGGVIQLESY